MENLVGRIFAKIKNKLSKSKNNKSDDQIIVKPSKKLFGFINIKSDQQARDEKLKKIKTKLRNYLILATIFLCVLVFFNPAILSLSFAVFFIIFLYVILNYIKVAGISIIDWIIMIVVAIALNM